MPHEFLRYSCQLALPGFSEATQIQLQHAKVLIAGAGGLGCPAAQYLAAAGIGMIGIADFDSISTSNLHRQLLYTPADVGLRKVAIACKKLQQQNPGIMLIAHDVKIIAENVMDIIKPYDIVLDCTDNFDTKYLLNDACVLTGKPLVYGAIYQYEGQVAVLNLLNTDGTSTPNYRDIFPTVNSTSVPGCTEGGVMPTLAGIIGCMQANEAIKYFSGQGELLAGKILMFDVQTMQSRIIKLGSVSRVPVTSLAGTLTAPVISVEELKKVIDKNVYQLVDVRTPEEHNEFNIGGKHLPVNEFVHEIPALIGQSIVVYCSSGKRSGEVVKLIKKSFPGANVFSLEGGLEAWREGNDYNA
jgi:sulfur-carrier protein adenylyltransferase/sulfurtransferase